MVENFPFTFWVNFALSNFTLKKGDLKLLPIKSVNLIPKSSHSANCCVSSFLCLFTNYSEHKPLARIKVAEMRGLLGLGV